jgi:hypothetical protein
MLFTVPDKRISVAVTATGLGSNAIGIAENVLEAYLSARGLYVKTTDEVSLPAQARAIPAEFAAYEGFYAKEDTLMRIKFNLPENNVTVYSVANGQETPEMSLIYNGDHFSFQGNKYYFVAFGGRHYFAQYAPIFDAVMITAQKLAAVANPIELNTAVDNRQWLWRNAKAYDQIGADIITSCLLSGLPGYIEFAGTKKIETPAFAVFAVNSARDLNEIILDEKDGVTWAWVSGLLYTPADSAPALKSGDTVVTIGRDGYNEWLRVPKDAILSFQPPKKGRVIVLNAGGNPVYDNYIDSESKILAPAGSFVAMAGNPGDTFKVTAVMAE